MLLENKTDYIWFVTAVFFAPIIHRLLHTLQIEQDDDKT